MKKRGQLEGEFFRYFLVIFIGVLIIIVGFKVISKVRSTSCTTSIKLFKDELKGSIEAMHGDLGSISEKELNAPCDVDKIYFVDLDRDMSSLNKSLGEYPLLMNAIESNVDKNVFFVKNEKVIDSFYAGDIELQKPYFVCSDTGKGNVELYLGGRAYSTEVVNKECVFDCTFEVVEVDYDTAKEMMEEAEGKCNGCPEGDLGDEMNLYNKTKNFLKISRRCNCGRKPGEAVVEILLKPEGAIKQFKLIERIPKDYVDDLYNYEPVVSGGNNVKVIYDPLIMWHFDVLDKETIVSYTLNTDVFEYCADVLETIGYGFPTLSDLEVSDDDLNAIKEEVEMKDIFKFELPGEDIEINQGGENNSIFNKGVWEFVSGTAAISNEVALTPTKLTREEFKEYKYEISMNGESYLDTSAIYRPTTSSGDYIDCSIIGDKRVSCEVGADFNGESHEFFIKVTNPDDSAELVVDSFTINVVGGIPFVDCSDRDTETACENSGCEWCLECTEMGYSEYADTCVNNVGECYYTECTDEDGDGYNVECDKDCLDDPNDPNAGNVPDPNNPYCDCNENTGEGSTFGIEEKGDLCFDGYDNNCNGVTDVCSKLGCTRTAEGPTCVWNFDDECDEWDRHWVTTNCCMINFIVCRGDTYICFDDWETECMENPICVGGTSVGDPINCFPTCTDNDGDGYSIEGGNCGKIDCNDGNPNANPEATEVCNDDVDNDCDGDRDCDDDDCSGDSNCICGLTSAYWSTDKAEAGDIVTLTAEGTDACCDKMVNFEVWEAGWWDTHMYPDPASHTFSWDGSRCIAKTTWTAIYVKEWWGNPEYYFKAIVPSENKDIITKGHGFGNPEFLEVTGPCFDIDGDGYGDPASPLCIHSGLDCDDNDPNVHPGAAGICDGKDNDCNGQADEGYNNENCLFVCQKNGYSWSSNGGNLNCCGNNAHEANPYQPSETNFCDDGNDNDCDGDTDCDDDDCSDYPDCFCDLTSAYWVGDFSASQSWGGSTAGISLADVGTELTLRVSGSTGCRGKPVSFKVFEDDLSYKYAPGQEPYHLYYYGVPKQSLPDPPSSYFLYSNCDDDVCTAETEWTTVWEEDSTTDLEIGDETYPLDSGSNPEYFFEAVVEDDNISTKYDMYTDPQFIKVMPAVAELGLEFTNINYQFINGRHYYYHTRIFRETNGVGVTLTSGRLCYKSGSCDSATVNYRIEANNVLIQSNRNFWTTLSEDSFTLEYWGIDDNSNPAYVKQTLNHP